MPPHRIPVERLAEEDTLSLAERAYRRLRDAIVQGALAAGSRISERSLATALGISAQPVREALRRLEQDGMVVTLPRRGTVVAEFGPDRQAEMGRIRAALEGAAAALAAEPGRRDGAGRAGGAVAGDAGRDRGGEARAGLGGQRTLPRR